MSGLKKPLSFDEQIDMLKTHGMTIEDEERAKDILSEINYYRFTGYALQFRNPKNRNDYVEGTSFDKVYRIYIFEEELRTVLKKHLDMVEIFARTQIAYGFSVMNCQTSPHNQHYNSRYFSDKGKHDEFCISLSKGKKYNSNSLFVKHHEAQYNGEMPLWVIVELLSFSALSKLYANMLNNVQDFIARNMGSDSRNAHRNNLHVLAILRNRVAHSARMYNIEMNPPVRLGSAFLRDNPKILTNSLFSVILVLLRRLPNSDRKKTFADEIISVIEKHRIWIDLALIGFPDDYRRLLNDEL